MVRAIIDGRKTQTRRVVTPHNSLVNGTGDGIRKIWPWLDWNTAWTDPGPSPAGNPGPCWKAYYRHPDYGDEPPVFRIYPRVEEGDTLWIKETFCTVDDREFGGEQWVDYRATPQDGHAEAPGGWHAVEPRDRLLKWRPSIFMRREFSRLDLDVLDVRGHRIQEITEAEALAEGVGHAATRDCKRPGFARLWDSINGKKPGRSWPENPPVWAYAFKTSPELFPFWKMLQTVDNRAAT